MFDNENNSNGEGTTYRYVGSGITQDNLNESQNSSGSEPYNSTETNSSSGYNYEKPGYTEDFSRFYTEYDSEDTQAQAKEAREKAKEEAREARKARRAERAARRANSGFFKNGKFFGKVIAAALVFGLVASVTFTSANSLLGTTSTSETSSDSSSSGGGATVTSTSSDESADATTTESSSSSSSSSDVSSVVAEAMPSIVSVTSIYQSSGMYAFGESESSTAAGSGIIVAETDDTLYIVTNNHVVEDADAVSVTFVDDQEVTAEIKGTDSSNDLAVLSVSKSDMESSTLSAISVATLGDSDELEVGETAIAIGNALGYGQSVTTGIISALDREVTIDNVTSSLIQTDAAINPGNSGGALLNSDGEVIGINSAKYSDTDVEGMGYAIPISTAIPIINELIEKETVSAENQAYLGITGVDVSSEVAMMYNMSEGVYVSGVVEGSAAESAGLQVGDILTSFDGQTITSMSQLQELMTYYEAGTTVEIVVQRAEQGQYVETTLSVKLGSMSN
ncbi:MAG: trypsin-like peptidase domain-containing protein [Eubacterium sp.]|nr:trypsin-like peptidase domain-containing protein [Eubacterium sp.]